jgi:hypothetical protein
MKKISLITLIALLFFAFACNESETDKEKLKEELKAELKEEMKKEKTEENKTSTESFETFYEKFVSDDSFQLERVKFPVKGENITDYDESEQWTADNWIYLDHIDDSDKELTVETDETESRVDHKIYLPNSGFSVSYSFELIDGKWYLTERTDASL